MRYAGELVYFDGDCGTDAELAVIQQDFISNFDQSDYRSVFPLFRSLFVNTVSNNLIEAF